jgi:hypothetical protein
MWFKKKEDDINIGRVSKKLQVEEDEEEEFDEEDQKNLQCRNIEIYPGNLEEYSKIKGQEFEVIKLTNRQMYEVKMEFLEIGYDDIPVWAFSDNVIDRMLEAKCTALIHAHENEDGDIEGVPVRPLDGN